MKSFEKAGEDANIVKMAEEGIDDFECYHKTIMILRNHQQK